MSTGLQSSGGKTKQECPKWLTLCLAVAISDWLSYSLRSQLENLGFPPRGVSTWLGLLTAGQLDSEREDLKGEHYKERKEKLPVFLQLGLRSPRTLCLLYSIDQSSHRASPHSKRKEISFSS